MDYNVRYIAGNYIAGSIMIGTLDKRDIEKSLSWMPRDWGFELSFTKHY